MKKAGVFLLGAMCALISTHAFAVVDSANRDQDSSHRLPFKEGRLLVKTAASVLDDAVSLVAARVGASSIASFSLVPGLRLFQFDESIPVDEAREVFSSSGLFEYVEPDYYYDTDALNDPRYGEQWALDNIGQTGGLVDADINATEMWALAGKNSDIVIGVIDTGVDYNHLDLIDNMWRNSLEIPADGIDQDGNGYVDDIFGINAITNTGNPLDDNSHGTHVAGTIGAVGNNNIGVVGVTQNVRIAGCKFLGANGSGTTSDAIKCLQYFANLKTRAESPVNLVATNNSWGSTGRSKAIEDAIRAHVNLGILFIAAAGNAAANADATPHFPAAFDLSNIISVAASDHLDRLATFSNYGKRSVHVGAPGVRILSTVKNQDYAAFSGTSMATPHVAGLVAAIKARFPDYDHKQIKNLTIASGTPTAAMQNITATGRRIRGADKDGVGAFTCIDQIVRSRVKPYASTVALSLGQSVFLSALHVNCAKALGAITVYKNGAETVVLQDDGNNGDAVADDGTTSLLWQPTREGSYALDFGGGDIVTVNVGPALSPTTMMSMIDNAYDHDENAVLNAELNIRACSRR